MLTPTDIKFENQKRDALRLAISLGHDPGLWEQDGPSSAVNACRSCDFLMAVDVGPGGGLSGKGLHIACTGRSSWGHPNCRCLECA